MFTHSTLIEVEEKERRGFILVQNCPPFLLFNPGLNCEYSSCIKCSGSEYYVIYYQSCYFISPPSFFFFFYLCFFFFFVYLMPLCKTTPLHTTKLHGIHPDIRLQRLKFLLLNISLNSHIRRKRGGRDIKIPELQVGEKGEGAE